MSARAPRRFSFSRKKPAATPSLVVLPERPSAVPPEPEAVTQPKSPPLPPEIWTDIVHFIPFEQLWLVRGTARLWNWVALIRAWHLIVNSEIGVYTFFDSEYAPLSYLTPSPELLRPSIPAPIQSNIIPAIEDANIPTLNTVVWRVAEPKGTSCEGLRFSYYPVKLEICFNGDIGGKFDVRDSSLTKGPHKDLARMETWTGQKKPAIKKLTKKIFTLKRDSASRTTRKFIEGGGRPDWVFKYYAQYNIGLNDDMQPAMQLKTLTMLEVSLPLSQVVRVWIDGLELKRTALLIETIEEG